MDLDGLDAIGIVLVARVPVRRPQLRQFVRCEPVFEHGSNEIKALIACARLPRKKLRINRYI